MVFCERLAPAVLERDFATVVVEVVVVVEEDDSTSIGAAGTRSSPGIAGRQDRSGDDPPDGEGFA
jgi:hypothetical protein